ncbi:hypothetical protein PM082_003438 [Marasmius tenuissimus]|nr:hypothetical protein PM082_003438 [Marasmius tenuissimus]
MLVIARTDAKSGKLISLTVDMANHEFIKGTTAGKSLAEVKGAQGKEIDRIEREDGAVEAAITDSTIADKEDAFKTFKDVTARWGRLRNTVAHI